ncbi:thiolase family protein, partial [Staphylococcus epidermidis]
MSPIVLPQPYPTPIPLFRPLFNHIPPYQLPPTLIPQILQHTQIHPNQINQLILPNLLHPPQPQNPPPIPPIHPPLPQPLPSFTLNKVSASRLKPIQLPYQSILPAHNHILIPPPIQTISQSPILLKNTPFPFKIPNQTLQHSIIPHTSTDNF